MERTTFNSRVEKSTSLHFNGGYLDITTVGGPRGFAGCYGDFFRTSSKKASTSNGRLFHPPSPIQFIGILAATLNTASCNCPLCFQVASRSPGNISKSESI